MTNPEKISQLGQDRLVLKLLNQKRNGVFVDAGAFDGKTGSNTLLLERQFGWTGLAIEANPAMLSKLRNCRTCQIEQCVLTDKAGEKVQFTTGEFQTCGVVKHIDDRYKHTIKQRGRIELETCTLTSALDAHSLPNVIDYLSLDIEGAELPALNGLDSTKYRFRVVTVEHNDTPRRNKLRMWFEANGYTFHKKLNWDDVYVDKQLL